MHVKWNISISKVYTLLLLFFPLISSYDLFGISPTFLFCLGECIILLIWMMNKHSVKINRRIWIYLIYMCVSGVLGMIYTGQGTVNNYIFRLFYYVLSFFVYYVFSWQIIDFEYAVRLYKKISLVLSCAILLQFVFSHIGMGFCLVPPGLRLAGEDIVTSDAIRATQISTNRYSTIFLEPAHQCEYILPCLAILLFQDNKKGMLSAMFITVGMFCTTSSIGILASAIIWVVFGLYTLKKRGASKKIYILLLTPILLGVFVVLLRFESISTNLIARLQILDPRNTARTEGFRRIRYGWICYGDMGLLQKIFGAGYKSFGYYLVNSGIGYRLLGTNDLQWVSYTNGLTGMLLGLGIIGTLLNLRLFLWDCLKTKKAIVYGLLLTWGLIMATANTFDDIAGVMPMILAMTAAFQGREKKHDMKIVI